ncbi:cysteine/glutathione ABC transporter permease/ATP-binding protein CydD [Shewanella sp. Scap07]|uniref:heme ABC transporter permease/ATP-binding protein CydD n=1 Tax=Shewanella sp. Scap07 TaxID=2589987 RepID=UPI0015C095E4|nr:cysteine/glutathione ABC transporter permease/ATP-binding protein CydD [Shewanella sp. Scap07]QLE86854.1 cysteine/glutathione ABC transporter permease/ATP-binding protein CydD [Shewanella sp. Scap07]
MDKSLEKILTRWLKQRKGACGVYLNLTVMLGVLTGFSLVAQAYLLATMLHGLVIENQVVSDFTDHFYALLALIVVRALLAYCRERVSFVAGQRLRQDVRRAVLDKLSELGPAYIKGKPAGSWASIVLEQVEDLHDFYGKYLPQMLIAGFVPITILAVVFPINWAAGLVLLATAPLIPMFMILVGMGAADANRKNFSALAQLSGHFMDRLKGLSTIKLFNRGQAEVSAIESASEEFRSRTMSVLRMAFLSSAVLEFFAAVSIAVLAVYFGFSYLDHLNFGHYGVGLTLFTGLFVLILAPEFYQPLRDMGTHYHAKAQAIGAAEALKNLLEYQTPQSSEQASQSHAPLLTAAEPITISAKQLQVMSMDGTVLLGPVDFTLNAGEHVALVGPSGAGKSSLLNALLGFLPYSGSLQVNGVELNQRQLTNWRQRVAWLGQNPQLFHGSIADNVSLGDPDMPAERIEALLAQAQVAQFVNSLPDGINSQIGEQSAGVSVGQAQRLCLARALGQQAQFYILDEPTASLDSQSEQAVMSALEQVMTTAGSIMVTHKIDELAKVDVIWVLDAGQLVQQGSFQQLSEQDGLFRTLLGEQRGESS